MMNRSNSERYKASFDKLHLSGDFQARLTESLEKEREDSKVTYTRTFGIGRIAAAAAVFSLLCGSVCYAADLGGIRTTIRLWINGNSKNIDITGTDNGTFTWTDENGEDHGFGGYYATDDGKVTALPADEMISYMNNGAELEFKDDRVIFHYHNLSEDVTDNIDTNGNLYVHVDDPANPNTYFAFSGIDNGTYSVDCSSKAAEGADYHEADAAGLISGDPAEALDENTEVSFTTQTEE